MMKLKLIAIIIFLIAFVTMVFFIWNTSTHNNLPIPYHTLIVKLKQDTGGISLQDIQLSKGYPQDYKLDYPSNFHTIEMISGKRKVLFTAKFLTSVAMFSEFFTDHGMEGAPQLMSDTETILYLPYFPSATKLVIYGEKKNQELEIPLEKYEISKDELPVNACGNGMCDSTENMLTCYKDCKRSMEFLWNKVKENYLP